ncbi:MAG: hypothetical protein CVU92_00855 [Firmicutes bacterium HGW-Firmicutes-17]|nr:MAG: hypothetical protein CVU92_00855 [Firmicutes bacterium HGW-Firmicutes-17]
MADVPFEDRFGLMVDREYTSRKNNRLLRRGFQPKYSAIGLGSSKKY